MALDPDVLAFIRSKVGDVPDNDDLEERYDRLGSMQAVAREVLSERRANMSASPARISIDGELSQDWTANLTALDRALEDPELYESADADPNELRIVQPARRALR